MIFFLFVHFDKVEKPTQLVFSTELARDGAFEAITDCMLDPKSTWGNNKYTLRCEKINLLTKDF